MEKPNILLIQVDQCSAESLGLFGNPLVRTPALEKLASRGITFQKAYCNYPACSPSRSSMFAGRYCSSLGIHANHMLLDPREQSLAHVLKDGGYTTALIGKNHAFRDGTKDGEDELHRLFDHVVQGGHGGMVEGYEDDPEVQEAKQWAVEHCWKSPIPYGTNPVRKEKQGSWLLGDESIKYLRLQATEQAEGEQQPFFLWLSFPDPHTPYQVAEPYASLYKPEDVPLPPKDDHSSKTERQRVAYIMDAMATATDDHMRRVRATHYGMINLIDDCLGRLVQTLEETGLEENTLILFTADHGDSMGAHGFVQKLNMFYDSFTRVPLLFSWPGRIKTGDTQELAELVDIMPTLLDFAGLEIPPGVQGKSLKPFLTGSIDSTKAFIVMESGEDGLPLKASELPYWPKDVWDESCFVWCAYREAWLGRGRSIRTEEWKLNVYADGEGELYNMKEDPDELKNLYRNESLQSLVMELKEQLLYWMLNHQDTLPINDTVKLHFQRDTAP